MITLTLNTTEDGEDSLKKRLLHSPLLKTHSTPTSSHSTLYPDPEESMTELKHSSTTRTTVMITLTLNTTEDGEDSLKKRPLHSPPHRTHCTPTSSHSTLCLDPEEDMTEPKLSSTTRTTAM